MEKAKFKIFIFIYLFCVTNSIMTCPTSLGRELLSQEEAFQMPRNMNSINSRINLAE